MIKQVSLLGYVCIAIAALALASVFASVDFIVGGFVSLVAGLGWGFFLWRQSTLGNTLSLLMIVLGISLAAILEGSRFILLVSLLATLSAWDLAAFYVRLEKWESIHAEEELLRTHLLRLASVLILGLALPIVAYALRFDLKFWQVFLLGILLLLGLGQVFGQLKRNSQ